MCDQGNARWRRRCRLPVPCYVRAVLWQWSCALQEAGGVGRWWWCTVVSVLRPCVAVHVMSIGGVFMCVGVTGLNGVEHFTGCALHGVRQMWANSDAKRPLST
jgi:hypothetical protein